MKVEDRLMLLLAQKEELERLNKIYKPLAWISQQINKIDREIDKIRRCEVGCNITERKDTHSVINT